VSPFNVCSDGAVRPIAPQLQGLFDHERTHHATTPPHLVLLSIAGVEPEAIVDDYLETVRL
jgi:hypothetical protein